MEVGGMTVSTLKQLLMLSRRDFSNRAPNIIYEEKRQIEEDKKSKKLFWFWALFEGGSILPYLLLDKLGVIDKPNWVAFIITTLIVLIIAACVTMDSLPGIQSPYGRKAPDVLCPVLLTGDHPLLATIICFAIPTVYIILACVL
jgi:hypothetical protein